MTPATLSPSPLAEMPCITTCTELPIDDTNKSTPDGKYHWLDPEDIRRNMTDKEILRMKLNLKDYSDSKVIHREKAWVALYYKSKEMNG